jgi:hypothetical protein
MGRESTPIADAFDAMVASFGPEMQADPEMIKLLRSVFFMGAHFVTTVNMEALNAADKALVPICDELIAETREANRRLERRRRQRARASSQRLR